MQLVSQTNTRGQNLAYTYDATGQLTSLTDASLGQVTSYAYDFSGRRVLERTMRGSIVYQDNHLGYDTPVRLRLDDDGHVQLQVHYDAVGNRTRIQTKVNVALAPNAGIADDIRSDDRWFQYDAAG